MAQNVYFKLGTQAKYDALEIKNPMAIYFIEDSQRIYKGADLFATGADATSILAGLMSASDKANLDELVALGLTDFAPVDGSITFESGQIGVGVSSEEGNILRINADGLYVPSPDEVNVPEYAMERQTEADGDAFATYKLKKTLDGVSEYVGDPINIPRDLMLAGGEMKAVTEKDEPYSGAEVGDPYIDLVLNDDNKTHIYIPVKTLVDVYTAGDGVKIEDNVISVVNKTDYKLVGTNGTAMMFNEKDGGGAKFEHRDGTWSFVGVNDGGENGITGQIYSVKKNAEGKMEGVRLNMTNNAFYYMPGSTSSAGYTADDEIATKGDISRAMSWGEI